MQNLNIKYIKGNNIMITGDSKVCKIPWDQTVTLNILQRNTVEKQTIVDQCVILHSGIDEGMFNNLEDGYYTVYHLIIPNINWLESNKKDISEFYRYNNIYVYKEEIIYKYDVRADKLLDVDLEQLLEINCNATNIISECKDIFIYNKLENCVISLLNSSLSSLVRKCLEKEQKENTKTDSKKLLYNRDFTYMILNMIKYYVHCEDYYEAERLLEEFNICFGYCDDVDVSGSTIKCKCHE